MAQLVTKGFHHVTLVSGDAARTVVFYRDVLGLRLVKKTVRFDEPTAYHLYFGDGTGAPGTLLTVVTASGARRGRWGVGGVHHVALGTTSVETLLQWKRRLTDRGVEVTGPYDRGYFTSIYFTDPDGHILEIATRGPGYAVDEPPHALGRRTVMPPPELVRGNRDEEAIRRLTHPEPVDEITPEMALQGIHHVSGITDDLERAHEFYTRALGLRLVKRTVNRDHPETPHYFWAHYDGESVEPGSSWTLFGWKGSDYRARRGPGQTRHVAFRAADAAELEAWREQLRSMGVEVSPVVDRHYFRSITFHAPDGQPLEIATDGPGVTVDEAPDRLGTELSLPPWLEPRRSEIAAALPRLP